MMLEKQLGHIDYINQLIDDLDAEIEERMTPFSEDLELIDTIPGIGMQTVQQILAEIGTDMSRYPSAKHLCSWAGLTPGHDESAGKKRSTKVRKGNLKLRNALT
nr:transposase [Alicyclobacillus mengziensis]